MIFTEYANDFWHKRKMYNFDPYNVLLAIITNIPRLRLVLCSRPGSQMLNSHLKLKINKSKDTLNVKLEPPVGVSKSLISESL